MTIAASGAVCAGSNPAGGAHYRQVKRRRAETNFRMSIADQQVTATYNAVNANEGLANALNVDSGIRRRWFPLFSF